MARLAQVVVAAGYAFAAWLSAGLLAYAAASLLPPSLGIAARCAGLAICFGSAFSLYFRKPYPLPALAAAGVALGLVTLLDAVLIAPYYLHAYELFLSFWDWQLPGALVAFSIVLARMKR